MNRLDNLLIFIKTAENLRWAIHYLHGHKNQVTKFELHAEGKGNIRRRRVIILGTSYSYIRPNVPFMYHAKRTDGGSAISSNHYC